MSVAARASPRLFAKNEQGEDSPHPDEPIATTRTVQGATRSLVHPLRRAHGNMASLRYRSALLGPVFFFSPAHPRARVMQIRHLRSVAAAPQAQALPATVQALAGTEEPPAPARVEARPAPAATRRPEQPVARRSWAEQVASPRKPAAREGSRRASSKIAWPARWTPVSVAFAATAPSRCVSVPSPPAAPRSWPAPGRAGAGASPAIAATSTPSRAPTARRMGPANQPCSRHLTRALPASSTRARALRPMQPWRSRRARTEGAPAPSRVHRNETSRARRASSRVAERPYSNLPAAMPCEITL